LRVATQCMPRQRQRRACELHGTSPREASSRGRRRGFSGLRVLDGVPPGVIGKFQVHKQKWGACGPRGNLGGDRSREVPQLKGEREDRGPRRGQLSVYPARCRQR
jgi:hypothetical protein